MARIIHKQRLTYIWKTRKQEDLAKSKRQLLIQDTFLDPGCSSHIINQLSSFTNTKRDVSDIELGDKSVIQATPRGEAGFKIAERKIRLQNALYSTQMTNSLISVRRLMDNLFSIHFFKKRAEVLDIQDIERHFRVAEAIMIHLVVMKKMIQEARHKGFTGDLYGSTLHHFVLAERVPFCLTSPIYQAKRSHI